MSLRIGRIEEGDFESFITAMSTPFLFDLDDDEDRRRSRLAEMLELHELDRARAAFDGEAIVGTLGAFTLPMTIPGGRATVAGTTMVTVLPSHRRRGALRSMIGAHFEDARERGEFMAALWASDSAIYHRFGYGMAAVNAEVRIDRSHTTLHRLAPPPRRVRMVGRDELRAAAEPLYEQVAGLRPGMYTRNDAWWDRRLRDRKDDREGATALRFAVTEGDQGVDGYVMYRLKSGEWESDHGDGEVRIRELISTTPGASTSLWNYVLGHDLVKSIVAYNLPEDDPIFALLDGWRRAAPKLSDNLWARILDTPAALTARRYAADGSLTLQVRDPMFDATTTHRLVVEEGVGETHTVAAEPDVSLDVEDLGAAYLGRARFRALARAGRVEGGHEALELADRIFAWDPAPWCQEVF